MPPMLSRSPRTARAFIVTAAALATALAASQAAAEDNNEISTDRPDFVESSSVVGKGVFQVETSVSFERDRSDGASSRTRSTPTLLRYGISEDVELRMESDGLMREVISDSGGSTTHNGMADTSIGAKWRLRAGDEARGQPALALLGHLDLDSGSRAFRGAGKVPSLRLAAEWELPGDASFGVMPGFFYGKDDTSGNRYWGGILAATYSRPLFAATRGFVEIAGQQLRSNRYGGNVVSFDTGMTYLIDRDTQLDFAINLALNEHTPDRTLSIGFSRRFR